MLANRIAQARWLLAGWLAVGVCVSAAAQFPARSQDAEEAALHLPADVVPKPGHGEMLQVQLPSGEGPVVRLHCELGDHLMVMLPTGGLKIVERSSTKPTDQPFRGADEASMKHALAEEGFSSFKMVAAGPYLYVYDSSEGFYLHTRSILESMYPGVVDGPRLDEGLQLQPQDRVPVRHLGDDDSGEAGNDVLGKLPEVRWGVGVVGHGFDSRVGRQG